MVQSLFFNLFFVTNVLLSHNFIFNSLTQTIRYLICPSYKRWHYKSLYLTKFGWFLGIFCENYFANIREFLIERNRCADLPRIGPSYGLTSVKLPNCCVYIILRYNLKTKFKVQATFFCYFELLLLQKDFKFQKYEKATCKD